MPKPSVSLEASKALLPHAEQHLAVGRHHPRTLREAPRARGQYQPGERESYSAAARTFLLAVSCLKTHVDDPATICSWPRGPPWEQSSSLPPHGIHRPGRHCCSALVQGAAAAQPEEKSKHRPFVERLPPLRRSKTRTLSLHVTMVHGRISGCHRHGPVRRAPCPRRRCFLPRRRLASWRVVGSHLWASRALVSCLAAL